MKKLIEKSATYFYLPSLMLYLIPVFLGFAYVFLFGISVSWWDQWELVPLFDKLISGELTFAELFAQHNEHRIFFPLVVMLSLGFLTKFNNVIEMYLIEILLLINLALIFLRFRNQFDLKKLYYWFIPVPFLVFNLRQHHNLLWGFQIGFIMALTFNFIAFYFIHLLSLAKNKKIEYTFMAAAVLSGFIASFSSIMGLFVWLAGLFQFILLPIEKSKKNIYTGFWFVSGLLTWILYFFNYHKPAGHPSTLYFLEQPISFLSYFFTCIGGSLFGTKEIALLAGIIITTLLIAALILHWRNKTLNRNGFWLAAALFSFLTVLSISVGRAGLETQTALESRYISFSIYLVIALYIMLLDLFIQTKQRLSKILVGLFTAIVIMSIPFAYIDGFEIGQRTKESRDKLVYTLAAYEYQPDELLQGLFPSAEVVKQRAPILKKLGYNVFADNPYNISLAKLTLNSSQTLFSIDSLNGLNSISGTFIVINGWAVDTQINGLAGGVFIEIDGKTYPAFYGNDRKDIADNNGNPDYRYSGFEGLIPASELKPGRHNLSLKILTKDRQAYYQAKVGEFDI